MRCSCELVICQGPCARMCVRIGIIDQTKKSTNNQDALSISPQTNNVQYFRLIGYPINLTKNIPTTYPNISKICKDIFRYTKTQVAEGPPRPARPRGAAVYLVYPGSIWIYTWYIFGKIDGELYQYDRNIHETLPWLLVGAVS